MRIGAHVVVVGSLAAGCVGGGGTEDTSKPEGSTDDDPVVTETDTDTDTEPDTDSVLDTAGSDTGPTGPTTPTEPTETGDTGIPPIPAGLSTFLFDAQYGVDNNNNVVAINSVYGALLPQMGLYFGNPVWTGDLADTTNYCTIAFDTPTTVNPAWVTGDPGLWFGLDFDVGSYSSTCSAATTAALDAAFLNGFGTEWGMAIGEVDATFYPYLYLFAAYEPNVIGGRGMIPPIDAVAPTEGSYSYGFEIDAGLNLIVDGYGYATLLEIEGQNLGNNTLAPGLYFTRSLFLYNL